MVAVAPHRPSPPRAGSTRTSRRGGAGPQRRSLGRVAQNLGELSKVYCEHSPLVRRGIDWDFQNTTEADPRGPE